MPENTTATGGNSTTDAPQGGQQNTAQRGTDQTQQQAPAYTPPATQADLDRIVESRLARERAKYAGYDDLKAKAEQFDQLQEANKTELQRVAERAEKAEKALAEARGAQLRTEVALAKNLPAELAGRLSGSTREELEADADKLAALIKPQQQSSGVSHELGKPRDNSGGGDWLRNALRAT